MISTDAGSHGQDPTLPPVPGALARLAPAATMAVPSLRVVAGRYRLVRVVASGPGWTCHLADDLESGQPVRLRLVSRDLADQEGFADRVHRHALLVRELSEGCPGIARLRDAGSTGDGGFFVAMEPVVGEVVGTLVENEQPLSPDGALRLAIRIGEVVEAAHNTGLIDGRLDPERALVLGSGAAVKLVDFGLDRALGAEPSAEQLAWLAPEIASGGPCAERADVYGIGALLYLLLTGRPPARAEVRSGASRPGGRRDLVPPGKLRPGIPRDVQAILFRALDHDPARRHEDVSVLLNDLSESLGLIAPVGRRHRPGAGLWRLAGCWRLAAGVLGAAAALAALWLVVPSAGLLGGASLRHGALQSGPSGLATAPVSALPRPATDMRPAAPAGASRLPEPDASTAAATPQPPPAAVPVPPASRAAAPEPPRPQEERALLPPARVPTPTGNSAPALSASRPRPAPGRPAVENPARAVGRSEFPRLAERSTPPRPTPTSRLDNDDPARVTAGAILRPSRAESPHPITESPRAIPSPREARARDGGEDPGAIIDWLLRDRR